MDLQSQLIESCKQKGESRWKSRLTSLGIHGAILAFIIFMGLSATHKVDAEDKPMHAFLAAGAPPPPPPPPPPPAPSSAPKSTPTPVIKPVQVQTSFVQPHETPKELPKVDIPTTGATVDTTPAPTPSGGEAGGVPGGVAGGVAGGVVGGVVGGQLGGVQGGVVGGTVGGTGTTEASPPPPPPEPKEEGPMRVGGDVKAPQAIRRTEPKYTDTARKAHLAGVVVVEAIIDKNGNVDRVKVLKGLDLGLTEQAVEAVKQWKFRPGTLNGEPVDVIFNLTVNFTLQ
jgi:periplasmic protein TonB